MQGRTRDPATRDATVCETRTHSTFSQHEHTVLGKRKKEYRILDVQKEEREVGESGRGGSAM